jgi:hypothetical protein
MLLLRDYFKGEEPLRLPPSKLGFLIFFVGDRGEAMSRREAVIESLLIAARNWRRERAHSGPGEYWYGKAALEHWQADLGEEADLSPDDREKLRTITWFNFTTIHDARKTAVSYVSQIAAELGDEAAAALDRAAKIYAEEVAVFDADAAEPHVFAQSVEEWTAEVRGRERETLARALALEEQAIRQIERTLEQLSSGSK